MPTPILGREMSIIVDSSVVAYGTDYSWGTDKEMIEITSLNSAGNKEFMPGDKSYSFDFSGLVSRTAGDVSRGYDYIMNSIITSDASVVVAVKPVITGNKYYEMVAFLKNVKMQGGSGNKAVTFSGTVQPTGPITPKTA
jgi:hypothetical protein